MIPRVHRHSASVGEVLHYLFGPGEYRDHHRPRVIAAWAYATVGGVDELQPATTAGGQRVLRRLVELLQQPVVAGVHPPPKPVWHCSLHNHAEDPLLSDQQWARLGGEFMAGVGLAPHDGLGAVRWVGIRHGDDHVHLLDLGRALIEAEQLGVAVGPLDRDAAYKVTPEHRDACPPVVLLTCAGRHVILGSSLSSSRPVTERSPADRGAPDHRIALNLAAASRDLDTLRGPGPVRHPPHRHRAGRVRGGRAPLSWRAPRATNAYPEGAITVIAGSATELREVMPWLASDC